MNRNTFYTKCDLCKKEIQVHPTNYVSDKYRLCIPCKRMPIENYIQRINSLDAEVEELKGRLEVKAAYEKTLIQYSDENKRLRKWIEWIAEEACDTNSICEDILSRINMKAQQLLKESE